MEIMQGLFAMLVEIKDATENLYYLAVGSLGLDIANLVLNGLIFLCVARLVWKYGKNNKR